jgi:hypothetical protein
MLVSATADGKAMIMTTDSSSSAIVADKAIFFDSFFSIELGFLVILFSPFSLNSGWLHFAYMVCGNP